MIYECIVFYSEIIIYLFGWRDNQLGVRQNLTNWITGKWKYYIWQQRVVKNVFLYHVFKRSKFPTVYTHITCFPFRNVLREVVQHTPQRVLTRVRSTWVKIPPHREEYYSLNGIILSVFQLYQCSRLLSCTIPIPESNCPGLHVNKLNAMLSTAIHWLSTDKTMNSVHPIKSYHLNSNSI